MRSLNLALFAEGPTDHRFLQPLIRRLAVDLCRVRSRGEVEIGDPLELHAAPEFRGLGRAKYVAEAARAALGGFHILCLHADGAGNPEAARLERCVPAMEALEGEFIESGHRVVAVVPVREMESWAIADGEALRSTFGTPLSDSELGIPTLRDVEGVLNPKSLLQEALVRVVGPGRRKHPSASEFLDLLGTRVALDSLRLLPSFQRFEEDLTRALLELGFLV